MAVLYNSLLMAQNEIEPNSKVTPPAKIQEVFQKEYPNVKPVWILEYVGDDNDEIRYEAKFKSKDGEALAVYDNLAILRAFELAIPTSKVPKVALSYLKQYYPKSKIGECSIVVDDKNKTTYEVGIQNNSKFYDVVFDQKGGFNVIIQKD